jgi:thiamine-phosphate pyrophosphorylase
VRPIVGPSVVIGLSTHTSAQLATALDEPVDYVAIGPVFETATKHTGYQAIGLGSVSAAAERMAVKQLPVVAIGGITLDRASAVIRAGADAVAIISDLLATGDPTSRVREYLTAVG